MKTHIFAISLMALAATLTGCDRLKAMSDEVRDAYAAASASSEGDPDAPDPRYIREAFATEQATMLASPGFAVRMADTLLITYNGKGVAQFTAPHALWTFAGTIDVTAPDGRHDRLARVYLDHGEIGYTAIVQRDGTVVMLDQDVLASPDGRTLASGYGETLYDSNMHVVEWMGSTYPRVAAFTANCYPDAWQDNSHFTVGCTRDEDDVISTLARISRGKDGSWRLVETGQRLDGNSNYATPPGLKLRVQTAQPDGASSADKDAAFARTNGYRRLADQAH